MQITKPINLSQLEAELAAAGIAINGLGLTNGELHTYGSRAATRIEHDLAADGTVGAERTVEYEEAGVPVDLPAKATAIVTAHLAVMPETKRAADLAIIATKAATDPAFAALARLVGLAG
ncbi:MAG TPA: hypothetical protein VNM48_01600 [Chloroflexota bacterium]|nr:hypothetical protein [Chloroflexota bacterium]